MTTMSEPDAWYVMFHDSSPFGLGEAACVSCGSRQTAALVRLASDGRARVQCMCCGELDSFRPPAADEERRRGRPNVTMEMTADGSAILKTKDGVVTINDGGVYLNGRLVVRGAGAK